MTQIITDFLKNIAVLIRAICEQKKSLTDDTDFSVPIYLCSSVLSVSKKSLSQMTQIITDFLKNIAVPIRAICEQLKKSLADDKEHHRFFKEYSCTHPCYL
ncbi:MAG: hypothetical protein Q8M62_08025 [Algoriphagus sp.]|uniref:hypothetical protein n=1 Tax=Algoriphagus sp. TaxID=1872435 RepID=UPI0027270BB8|nr:hypothetical protein [Algoriphagus sp.]MDO8966917.1 hypothetical protein [Algoriphagus sp.]MDP3199759.1 hypothetical protein [Algoriphagus sp.]